MVVFGVVWASVALRIVLGVEFIVHGYPKLKDVRGTAGFLEGLGFKPGMFWAVVLGLAEFVGGLAFLTGAFTRIFAAALTISMLIALLVKKFKWKVSFSKGSDAGWEWDWLIVGGLIALFFLGSGAYSVDQYMGWIWG